MSEEIKPQVGDLWKFNDEIEKVLCVGDFTVFLKSHNCLEWVCSIEVFLDDYEIVERDGKPCKPKRVFENGAWYPALIRETMTVVKYHGNKSCFPWQGRALIESDFSWIGDKLEINWPESKS